jgi:hypothetical protein
MPIKKRWTRFTTANVKSAPEYSGVYELADSAKNILYIGKSDATTGVRGRLLAHLRGGKFPTARYFRCDESFGFVTGADKELIHTRKYKTKFGGRKPKASKRLPRRSLWL